MIIKYFMGFRRGSLKIKQMWLINLLFLSLGRNLGLCSIIRIWLVLGSIMMVFLMVWPLSTNILTSYMMGSSNLVDLTGMLSGWI